MADACLWAEGLDRINVQNNPVNMIDEWGLEGKYGWTFGQSWNFINNSWRARSHPAWKPPRGKPVRTYPYNPRADLNGDGCVDDYDMSKWLLVRLLWNIFTPPGTSPPPGYGDGGPGTTDPRLGPRQGPGAPNPRPEA